MILNSSLPVNEFLEPVSETLLNKRKLVLSAEPGAGKSTAVPFFLLHQPWLNNQKIIMLEPRRLAARSIAHYLASALGEKVGQRIGYRIKNETKVSAGTQLEIVTEGVLTRLIQQDPELSGVGLIIFDEFHERNLQSDLGLMLVQEICESLREDLACLVMSATIDAELISRYLSNEQDEQAKIINCPGRAYPVEVQYREQSIPGSMLSISNYSLAQLIYRSCQPFFSEKPSSGSDILVFLPGQAAIFSCLRYFEEQGINTNIQLLPLYGALSLEQQNLAISVDKSRRQKVIFATNIAETSLTIEGVSVVIDSGLERQSVYDVKTGMSRLETSYISKASAKQRAGRAGRLSAGECVRLWSGARQNQLKEFHLPEVSTSDLCDLVLQLAIWGNAEAGQQRWLTKPPDAHYEKALYLLREFGFLERENRITDRGKRASELGINVRLAAILLSVESPQEKRLAALLAAILSEQDVLKQFHTVDLNRRIAAVLEPTEYEAKLKHNTLKQIKQSWQKLDKSKAGHAVEQSGIGRLLFSGFSDLLARRRPNSQTQYLLTNGRGAQLAEEDPLCGAQWLLVLSMDAQSQSGRIWLAVELEESEVLELIAPRLKVEETLFWDEKAGQAKSKTEEKFGALVISTQISTALTTAQKQQFLMQQIREQGLKVLNWTKSCQRWLERASWLSGNCDDFHKVSESALLESLEEWLLPYIGNADSIAALKKVNIQELLVAALDWESQSQLEEQAPENFGSPSGKTIAIQYSDAQGPIVSLQLQELFGLTKSPLLAGGKVPLRFEMLSPARRPIQTTSDLNGFWQSSYFEVAKEMRGRYPKHRWPEEPLLEKPGRSIKSKKIN